MTLTRLTNKGAQRAINPNEFFGGSIYKGSNGNVVRIGDEVPSETTHLHVLVGGEPALVEFYPLVSGYVSSIGNSGAVIGGVSVDFYLASYSKGWVDIRTLIKKSDLSSDVSAKYNQLVQLARDTNSGIYHPPGWDVRFENLVDMRFIPLAIHSKITGPDNTTLIHLGGRALDRRNPRQYIRRVDWDDDVNGWKANTPQIVITGMMGQIIDIDTADFVQVQAYGDSTSNPDERSSAYSELNGAFIRRLELKGGDGSDPSISLDGWINENEFNIRSCFYFAILDSAYNHNNNVINGGTFEGTGLNGDGVVIDIQTGTSNNFRKMRFEGSPIVKFSSKAKRNSVEYSWTSAVPSAPVNIVDEGEWNSVFSSLDIGRPMTPILNVTAKNLSIVGPDGENHIEGLKGLTKDVTGKKLTAPAFTRIYQSDLIPSADCPEIGASVQGLTSGGIRVSLTAYDENLNVITSNTPGTVDYRIIGVSGDVFFQPEGSGATYPSIDNGDGSIAWVTREGAAKCKYVQLQVVTGGSGLECSSLFVHQRVNTDFTSVGSIAAGKNNGGPVVNTPRVTAPEVHIPYIPSQVVNAGETKAIVFNTAPLQAPVNSPCACSRDVNNINQGIIFDAAVTGTNEITVYATNITSSNLNIASGTRVRVSIFRMYTPVLIA